MSDASTPQHRDADDARADSGPPTDAVSDEVKTDAVSDEVQADSVDDVVPAESDVDSPDAGNPAELREGDAEPQVGEPTD